MAEWVSLVVLRKAHSIAISASLSGVRPVPGMLASEDAAERNLAGKHQVAVAAVGDGHVSADRGQDQSVGAETGPKPRRGLRDGMADK